MPSSWLFPGHRPVKASTSAGSRWAEPQCPAASISVFLTVIWKSGFMQVTDWWKIEALLLYSQFWMIWACWEQLVNRAPGLSLESQRKEGVFLLGKRAGHPGLRMGLWLSAQAQRPCEPAGCCSVWKAPVRTACRPASSQEWFGGTFRLLV